MIYPHYLSTQQLPSREVAVKNVKLFITYNFGLKGNLDSDKFQGAMLQYRNCPAKDTKLSSTQCILWKFIKRQVSKPPLLCSTRAMPLLSYLVDAHVQYLQRVLYEKMHLTNDDDGCPYHGRNSSVLLQAGLIKPFFCLFFCTSGKSWQVVWAMK